jgi:hypothetical protein
MKFFIILIAAACLMLHPWSAFSDSIDAAVMVDEQSPIAVDAPGVAPPLVREGDFSVKLAEALETGSPQNEAAAESTLASIGIAPDNGWIADYPVTPEIIAQLQNSIQKAVDSGSLEMSSASAMAALRTVSDDFDLNIVAGGSSENQDTDQQATGSSENASPAEIDNYYYDSGPPVVTYYSPPPAFVYLYAWVPCPFWFADIYFPGFFILNDFDTFVTVHRRRAICTNHVFSRRTGRFFLVHPVNGRHYRSVREFPHANRFEIRRNGRARDHHAWTHDGNFGSGTLHHKFAGMDSPRPGYGERYPRPAFRDPHHRMGNFAHRGSFGEFHGTHFGRILNGVRGHGNFGGGFHGTWSYRR